MSKPTLALYVSAHNEAAGIGRFLESVLEQNTDSFASVTITVACDGCTDATAAIIKRYAASDERIVLIDDGRRVGKLARMNEFYRTATSDLLVVFDADIVLAHPLVLARLTEPFADPAVGIVGGVEIPASPRTMFEKIAVTWALVWYYVRRQLNGGNSVHNLAGCVYALRRSFYQDLSVPPAIVSDDEFLYFEASRRGVRYAFAPSAAVLYRCPANYREYIVQSSRHINTKYRIAQHFGGWVVPYYRVPKWAKLRALVNVFTHTPLWLVAAVLFQAYFRLFKLSVPYADAGGMWNVASSTK